MAARDVVIDMVSPRAPILLREPTPASFMKGTP